MNEKRLLEPVAKDHTNMNLVAEGCSDLPATRTDVGILSVWKCASIWQRIKFLFTGEICLHIFGQGHPPVSIIIGDLVENDYQEHKS